MRRLLFFAFLSPLLLAASSCGQAETPKPVLQPGERDPAAILSYEADPAGYAASMKKLIRAHAAWLYGPDCRTVTIPEDAFLPVEITGGRGLEYAVSLGRAQCGPTPSSFWQGSGGMVVQFWRGEDGRPALLLEQQIGGFTPSGTRLVTMQHGGYCGSWGTNLCRVTYEWDSQGGRLETVERKFYADLPPEWPEYSPNCLLGTGPCPGAPTGKAK